MPTVTPSPARTTALLARAAHMGPALAVTTVVLLLALSGGLPADRVPLVVLAVFAGQLTIGWSNDLLDARRDQATGRPDKPVATGELARSVVTTALVTAAAACVALSFLVGWRSALVHLGLGVASGHLYNLALKGTWWSWLPYAVAFGTLPAVVTLADVPPRWPPPWMVLTAATLGVAAHLLNALPDLDDDVATGIRGLPHRIGRTASKSLATALLVVGSAVAVLGPPDDPGVVAGVAFGVVLVLDVTALVTSGRTPFRAAIGIALVDVALLTVVPVR
jgi:4-hydroxybenzoate polyprenyltransferase